MTNVNTRLKELRTEYLKLTQEQFAATIGISRPNLTNMENGKIQISDRMMKTICSVHNVNESWLRNGIGEKFFEMSSDDEFDYLIGKLYAEDDEFKKKVIKSMLKLEGSDWVAIKSLVSKMGFNL